MNGMVQDGPSEHTTECLPLYILGHGRSGTTAMARYLNTDRSMLILNEAFADTEGRYANWRQRYNVMHVRDGQPPIKGYYIDPSYGETFEQVRRTAHQRFRFFGDKNAISTTEATQYPAMVASIKRRWLDSEQPERVLLTVRHPDLVLASSLRKFPIRGASTLESLRIYTSSLSAIMWLQLTVYFGSRLSAWALMDHAVSCDAQQLADTLKLGDFQPSLSQAVFAPASTHPSAAGAAMVAELMEELSETEQYLRYLLLEVFAALEHGSSFRTDGLMNSSPQFLCRQKTSRLYGAFSALHEYLSNEGILEQAQLHESTPQLDDVFLDAELPGWQPESTGLS